MDRDRRSLSFSRSSIHYPILSFLPDPRSIIAILPITDYRIIIITPISENVVTLSSSASTPANYLQLLNPTQIHTYIYQHTHTHIHIHTYSHTHTHIHKHIPITLQYSFYYYFTNVITAVYYYHD